jgi:hypothetical protein
MRLVARPGASGLGPRGVWMAALAIVVAAAAVIVAVHLRAQRQGEEAPAPSPTPTAKLPGTQPLPPPATSTAPTTAAPAAPVRPPKPADPNVVFADDFATDPLRAPERWVAVRDGDFREAVVDIVEGRLRLRAGTIGTRDDTVKHLGIRTTTQVVDLSSPIELAATIDWNSQANGCYLRASLYLCPTAAKGTAKAEPDWLKFEYVGVPPGKNGRALLARRRAGQLRHLFTEGWPKEQRTGRPIGKQSVVLRLGPKSVEILENGKRLYGPAPHELTWRRGYLHLELSSHSNYPPRELFFDDLTIRRYEPPQSF